jgi:hypothetical protein
VSVRVSILLAALLASAGAAFAADGKEQVKLNAHDNALARAAVIQRVDLGPASGWKGGMTKPDLTPISCPGYHPKQSDLVLTGVAESHFTRAALDFRSDAQVLQTAQMVRLDWQRSIETSGVVPCLRSSLVKSLGSVAKVVSFAKRAFPQVATYAAAYRALVDIQVQGKTVGLLIDLVVFGRNRTELTLTVTAPAAAAATISAAEARLARILVARARA